MTSQRSPSVVASSMVMPCILRARGGVRQGVDSGPLGVPGRGAARMEDPHVHARRL
ncbi:hypothetical protein GCM10009846_16610 [Agrococcus versicolor]|uniref:Uncharacterized protein n=1 Tax=Agrococcus versicolor TaxID=501482 RepID=A0ABN3AR41_9MICO